MPDGDGTIESALEVTRNLHRLIISVSVITVIFAFSLSQPKPEKAQQHAIQEFLNFDFRRYDNFVERKIEEVALPWLKQPTDDLRASLENSKPLIFGTQEIVSAFGKPTVLGRFKVSESKLITPGDVTLRQLEMLEELFPLSTDVRVLVPDVADVAGLIGEFLTTNGTTGMKVQSVQVQASDVYPDMEPPAEGDLVKMTCFFELFDKSPPIPVFQSGLDAKVRVIPGTSFADWLSAQQEAAGIGIRKNGKLSWLPALEGLPREQAERRLGDVLASLKTALEKGSPDSQKVSLLGADIPGSLLIYATPPTLLALCYYLLSHLRHLSRYAVRHAVVMQRFAWLPLTLEDGWVWETRFSLGVLPLASLVALSVQLFRFGFLTFASGTFIVLAICAVGWFFKESFREVAAIRGHIGMDGGTDGPSDQVDGMY